MNEILRRTLYFRNSENCRCVCLLFVNFPRCLVERLCVTCPVTQAPSPVSSCSSKWVLRGTSVGKKGRKKEKMRERERERETRTRLAFDEKVRGKKFLRVKMSRSF